MPMTEEEAKKCWCPMTAPLAPNDLRGRECIASQCMAFRWSPDATLALGGGVTVIVDEPDAHLLDGCWYDGRYAKAINGYLHILVLEKHYGEAPDGMFGDHIDGDTLNNRLGNLRWATPAQNAANSATRGGKSSYRGVFQAANGNWVAQISKNNSRKCLGTFATEVEAAAAYDAAAKEIHGEFARLNLTKIQNSGRQGYCGLAGKE